MTELPAASDTITVVAGYQTTGTVYDRNRSRELAMIAHSTGGELQFFTELERTGFRLTVPSWAAPLLAEPVAGFFRAPDAQPIADSRPLNFREKVEEEIRDGLLGLRAQSPQFGTDRAFVSVTGPIPGDLQQALAAVPARASTGTSGAASNRLPAERTLRFKADETVGGVIFASPVPSLYYREWYSILLLDRLIQRVVTERPVTALELSLHPYYYRIELQVPSGRFPEAIEESLLQDLQRLQFSRPTAEDLDAARASALEYLRSRPVVEWFSSQGIPERLAEGIQWIELFTADDLRAAARDLLIMNRVIATWPPKAQTVSATVEVLSASGSAPEQRSGGERPTTLEPLPPLRVPAFPAHSHNPVQLTAPERLPSGVSIVTSTSSGVFAAGESLSSNSDPANWGSFRADRILVLSTPSSLATERQRWSSFSGSAVDGTQVFARGEVATGDLSALFLLKVLLERKIIEAGLWRDMQLRIDAAKGSSLEVLASDANRAQLLDWIKAYAATPPSDAELSWVREVAQHHLLTVLPHLQAITWQRDPLGVPQDLQTVGAGHIQDVARIYFSK